MPYTIIIGLLISGAAQAQASIQRLSPSEIQQIGQKIWRNECGGRIDLLTFWNKQEPFPSLGIGHFIWFPKNCAAPYTQTFPDLIAYLKKRNVTIPSWLDTAAVCPFNNREEFYGPSAHTRIAELRDLLVRTIDLQAEFMVHRLSNTLSIMLAAAPHHQRAHVERCFNSLNATAAGCFVLIDYLNFKGDGTNPCERYDGHGWGLLQVLMNMRSDVNNIIAEFSNSARHILEQRVLHAPRHANEKQWLPGWLQRVSAYNQ